MSGYGTTQGVATLVPQYAENRNDDVDFSGRTRPTKAQLLRWMEQMSSMLDTSLRTEGFITPITADYEEPYNSVTFLIEQFAATLVEGVNGYQRAAASKSSGWSIIKELAHIHKLIKIWIEDNAPGLEEGGLPRPNSTLSTLMSRDTEVESIFRRNQYNGIDTAP